MAIKFYFNQKAWEATAREFRRASWGIAALLGAGGYKLDSSAATLVGGLCWVALQCIALMLDSLQDGGDQ